jgi:hypothetical protein
VECSFVKNVNKVFEIMYSIQSGHNVLVVWGSSPAEKFQNIVGELQKLTGSLGKVAVENIDRLTMGMY